MVLMIIGRRHGKWCNSEQNLTLPLIFNFQGTTLKCLSSGGDAKLYRCEFCSVPFSTIRSLNMHKTKSHGPNMTSKEFSKPLEIDIGKIKSEKLDLDSYMKKQYSMESTKDKCSFCHVRFTTKQTMKASSSYLDSRLIV